MQYIVSPDGAGDFTSLQAAVDAVPAASAEPVTVQTVELAPEQGPAVMKPPWPLPAKGSR